MLTSANILVLSIILSQVPAESLSLGDMTVVTTGETQLMSGNQVQGSIEKGIRLKVSKIQGEWFSVRHLVSGKELQGWVQINNVMIVSDPRRRHLNDDFDKFPTSLHDGEDSRWRKSLSEYTPTTEDGRIVLTLDSALALARIHSPLYQRQLETLYRSALDISTERMSRRGTGKTSETAIDQQKPMSVSAARQKLNVSEFQRFRQGFYTWIAIGDLGVPELTAVGDATQVMQNHSGTGSGAGGGTIGFAGGGAGSVGGFIGLLQQLQQIRNTEDSLRQQIPSLFLLEDHQKAGVIDLTQVDQFRQSIETERANLLQARNQLQNSIEIYLSSTLGLPPNFPVNLDDSLITRFQLVDPTIISLQDDIGDLQVKIGQLPDAPELGQFQKILTEIHTLRDGIAHRLDTVQEDLEMLEDHSSQREKEMSPEEQALFAAERNRLRSVFDDVKTRLIRFEERLREMDAELKEDTIPAVSRKVVVSLKDLIKLTMQLTLIQARARLESVVLEPIELDSREALRIAIQNRPDVLRFRSEVADSWNRNQALQSRLNSNSSATPLDQLERNRLRLEFIHHEQHCRQLLQYEDSIHFVLREKLRRLNQLRVNLEIQRRAMAISIRRVDLTQDELRKTISDPQPGLHAAAFGPTAALSFLTALSDLRNTQNNFMSVYVNYEADRMTLLRELGIMVIDEDGRWVDLPLDQQERATAEESPLPPALEVPDNEKGESDDH